MKYRSNVLLVEDNEDLRTTLAMVLRRSGYAVDTAVDGRDAVERFSARHYDVTLMDLIMPRLSGVEAFYQIRDMDDGAAVILMTGYYDESLIRDAVHEGARCALHKPLDIPQLLGTVARTTEGPLVLVVDDNRELRRTMARALQHNGRRVCAAGSGEDALRVARQKRCGVAFLDIRLPAMDGVETYLKLRETNPDLAAVIMTGYRSEVQELIDKAMGAKALGCLHKPFHLSEAIRLLQSVDCTGGRGGRACTAY